MGRLKETSKTMDSELTDDIGFLMDNDMKTVENAKLRARIAELEAEVADLNECLTIAHMDGFEKGRDAARAAYMGEKE